MVNTVAPITAVSSVSSVLALADMYTTGYTLNTIVIIILFISRTLRALCPPPPKKKKNNTIQPCTNSLHVVQRWHDHAG